jgi:hypothetical protein
MKYLLFINFNSGLMHNNIYNDLDDVYESLMQLVQEEKLIIKREEIPRTNEIKRHLEKYDDYFKQFSNGTWYHIQPYPAFV